MTTMNIIDQLPGLAGFTGGESLTGYLSGTVNVTVNETVVISWNRSQVNFFLNPPESGLDYTDDTTDGSPPPLAIRNDGATTANISIYASDQLFNFSAQDGGSDYNFSVKCGQNGTKRAPCDITGGSPASRTVFSPVNISSDGSTSTLIIWNMSFEDQNDTYELELNVSVPKGEPAGGKFSTLVITAVAACSGDPRCDDV
jgi:hypothetical protein